MKDWKMMIDLSHYLTKRVSLICALLILLIFIFRIVYFLTPAVPNPSFTRVISIADDVAFTENTDNSRHYCQTVYYTPSPNGQSTINLIKTSFSEISFIRIDKKADLLKYQLPTSSIILIQHLPQQKNDLTMKYLIELKQRLQLKLILFVHDLYFLYHYPSTAICPIISNMDAIYYNSSALKLQFERSCGTVAPNILIAPSHHVVRQHSQLKGVNIGVIWMMGDDFVVRQSNRSIQTLTSLERQFKEFHGLAVEFHETPISEKRLIVQLQQVISQHNMHAILYLDTYHDSIIPTITALGEKLHLPILFDNKDNGWEKYSTLFNSKTIFPLYDNNSTTTTNTPNTNLFRLFLNAAIENNAKLTTQMPIKPLVPFLHHQISPYAGKDNLFMISSKILVSQQPFSYIKKRSIYTTEDRLNQTIETIESIRKYAPNSFIVLIDNSKLSKHFEKQLNEKVDLWIQSSDTKNKNHKENKNHKILTYYTNDYPYKGFAELSQLIYAYNTLFRYMKIEPTTTKDHHPGFKAIFKITGRYTLRSSFNVTYYQTTPTMIFKRNEELKDLKYYYTCFYKIEKTYFHEYFHLLKKLFLLKDFYIKNNILNLEEEIPLLLNYNFTEPKELGIKQNIAVWKDTKDI